LLKKAKLRNSKVSNYLVYFVIQGSLSTFPVLGEA
jgi:hypothetical protein